jgi:hypothetical protein
VWLVKTDANGVLPIDPNALAATAFTSVSVLRGWTWYFFVHHNGGEAPYTYQWYEGTALMSGESSQWLPVSKMSTGTFTFYCKVTDAQGRAVTSNGVTLRVIG